AREVTVLYRKDKQYIPARDVEVEYALIDGVQFLYRARPLEITPQGVQYVKTLEEENAPGRYHNTEETALLSCDTVIIAISQDPRATIPDNSNGLETGIKGLLVTDSRGHTTRKGIFASGDVVTGAKTVVEAVAQSKIVVQAMEEYLEGKIV
ncbi:MAG TPA: FAD-dependent oxidoreductase, partial [Synergistaceae bacterium]|nr:FAD-dependent oxidoreductase [Synergistaceae bacterium]